MNIFKKLKRHLKIGAVLSLTCDYKEIEIKEPIIIGDIYIVKEKDDLIFFVKKDNWKKYIGINRICWVLSQDNSLYCNYFYKTSDLKNITTCYESDIPKEMIEETYDKLIERMDDLKNVLKGKKNEEFYI